MDPMTTAEAAYEESEIRADEARKEQHFAEAEDAARDLMGDADTVDLVWLLARAINAEHPYGGLKDGDRDTMRTLVVFRLEYGTPALLRVIARALEAK